jgi:predicted dehydrogenase
MRLVAVYERDDRRRREAAAALGVTAYWELEPFLDHPMDAVIYLPRPPRVARRDADPLGDGVAR